MAKISKDALICFIKDVIKENGKEPKDIYFERSNGGYHGIITKGEDDDSPNISCSPVINVDYLYDEYCGDNMTIGDILGYVNHVLTVDVGVNGNNLINEMMDWNKAKTNSSFLFAASQGMEHILLALFTKSTMTWPLCQGFLHLMINKEDLEAALL